MKAKKESVTVRMPADIVKWIEEESARKRISKTEMISRILVARMERDKREGGFLDISPLVSNARMVAEERTKYRPEKIRQ